MRMGKKEEGWEETQSVNNCFLAKSHRIRLDDRIDERLESN